MLHTALVRICSAHEPVGAGVLVSPRHVVTCAHVAADALGLPRDTIDLPTQPVTLDFPLLASKTTLTAQVVRWYPLNPQPAPGTCEDLAVLELTDDRLLPPEAKAAPLLALDDADLYDRRVRMCGFPQGFDQGHAVDGELKGGKGDGNVQINLQIGRRPVAGGFSGTPVWDKLEQAVVGIVVKIYGDADNYRQEEVTAYMIPARTLIRAWPELDQHSRPLNPYRGLEAFREEHAAYFFGRADVAQTVEAMVTQQPFGALIGASGSGKSSVVYAGLLPRLRAMGDWLIVSLRPKTQPFAELALNLLPWLYPDKLEQARKLPECVETLKSGQNSLSALLQIVLQNHPDRRLLLLVDQFEELYTLTPDRTVQQRFTECLRQAVQTSRCTLLLTLRADFMAQALDCDALAKLLDAYPPKLLSRMDETQLRAAIEEPARTLEVKLESGLSDLILRDVGQEPGNLPLLEFALTALWQRMERRCLTHAAYASIGGVKQALTRHADTVFQDFSTPAEQEQVRRVFIQLVSPGEGTEDTRQVATLEQVPDWDVVRRLADTRLVVTGRDEQTGVETVEVVHEALIRHWQPLREWLKTDRAFRVWQNGLRQSLKAWEATGQDDGALLRGARLAEAEEKLAQYADVLSVREKSYIKASLDLREHERREMERTRAERTRSLFDSHVTHAALLAKKGVEDYAQAREILSATYPLDADILATRRHARNLLAGFVEILGGAAEQVYTGADAALTGGVAVSPDGRLLAAAGERGTLVLFDAASGELLARLAGHDPKASSTGDVRSIVFHPQGEWLASAGDDGQIIVWRVKPTPAPSQEGKPTPNPSDENSPPGRGQGWVATQLRAWNAPAVVSALAVSPDGAILASGGTDKNITLWNPATGEAMGTLQGHSDIISGRGLTFSPDGTRLASASYDDTARVWDVQNRKEVFVLRGHNDNVLGIAFSLDGRLLATSREDIRLWDMATGEIVQILQGHSNKIFGLRFVTEPPAGSEPAGGLLISASFDRTLRVWDVSSGVTLRVLQGHDAGVGSVTVLPTPDPSQEGNLAPWVYSASNDGTVRRWNLALPQQRIVDLPGEAASAAIAPDGQSVAVGFADRSLRVYSLPEGALLAEQKKAHSGIVTRLAFNREGSLLASGSSDNTAKVWQVVEPPAGLKPAGGFEGHTDAVQAVAFAPDGQTLATASYDGRIGLFRINHDREPVFKEAHKGKVASVSFDATGTRLLSSGIEDFTMRLWDVSGDQPALIREFPPAQDRLLWSSLSPDGAWAASVGRDQLVHVAAVADGQEVWRLAGHEQAIFRAIFSPDSRQLATVSSDAKVKLWDLDSGGELFTLRLPTNAAPPVPAWDFDFRCVPGGRCWIAVPLTRGKLVLYDLGEYEKK